MGRTKRKTGGSLSVDAGDLLFGMIQHIDELIKKFDSLGIKFEKMPGFAKKMADTYVSSFTAITASVKDLSSKSDKLTAIASGLGSIATSTKKFSGTETQAAAIASLSDAMSKLSGSITKFPKDTSGVTAFTDGIKQLNTAFSKLKTPDAAKIKSMNQAADAIRNIASALKTAGSVPPDVMAAFAAATGGGASSSPPPLPPTSPAPAPPATPPTPPPPTFREKAMGYAKNAGVALAGAAIGAGVSSLVRSDSSAASLSQVLPMANEGWLTDNEGADFNREMKRTAGRMSAESGLSNKGSFNILEMMARYTANGNRGSSDMRTMSEAERRIKATGLSSNAMEMNLKTGLDTGSAADLQLSLERSLGVKAPEFEKLKDTFIALARSGSLTAKDLLAVSEGAKDAGTSFQLSGDAAKEYVNSALISATAVANAGIKQSATSGMNAGFFGDEKALIADLAAGITDDDYKNHPEEVLRKQMAWANQVTAGMGNDRFGNLMAKKTAQAGIISGRFEDTESFRTQQGLEPERLRQVEALRPKTTDSAVIAPVTTDVTGGGGRVTSKIGGYFKESAQGPKLNVFRPSSFLPDPNEESVGDQLQRAVDNRNKKSSGGIVEPARHGSGALAEPGNPATSRIAAPGKSGDSDIVPALLTPKEEVLTPGDPRHRYNIDAFKQSFAQIEGYNAKGKTPNRPQRNLNPGNLRVDADWKNNPEKAMHIARKQGGIGYDAQGYLKFDSEAAGFAGLERQMKIDAKRGMNVSGFIEKYAPASENNTAAYKEFIKNKGFAGDTPLSSIVGVGGGTNAMAAKNVTAPALAEKGFSTNPLAALSNSISSMFSGIMSVFSAQKPQQQAAVQLDPSVMASLASIANANSGSSDTMAEAIGLFAKVVQNMSDNSRSRSGINNSSDLIASVARGNYAYTRGA